ncbi:PREDICTED: protein FAM19A3 isoform X1 [Hipposideros armiger]|uniref:Protein FAM19A3 isoform X1 n=1 Tax=Hipposideros armiger TaxID=186990 RepID=A0A8B7SRQ1_HIPAR|nr:PREDICTED: protein FAM19A3 isoform X1 [Hipposideros armiger]
MFTLTQPLSGRTTSAARGRYARLRPPPARPSAVRGAPRCPGGGSGVPAGLEDRGGGGSCKFLRLPLGGSLGGTPVELCRAGRAGPKPPDAHSGTRHDWDASLARVPTPPGRSNLVRGTRLRTRQHANWPLPPGALVPAQGRGGLQAGGFTGGTAVGQVE